MSWLRWLAGLAGAVVILVAGDVASEEIRGRLDRLPFAVLRLARSRLPAGLRERVHDEEWVPELEHVLEHAELFPLTRLFTGLRFAAGLLIRAGSVAAELAPDAAAHGGGTEGRSWWRRLAGRSASMLHATVWPVRERLPVRLYVACVITAAAAAVVAAAASATLHARDLELFVILVGCGSWVARGSPRVAGDRVYNNLMGTWFLAAAVLLPPVYALIVPVPLNAVEQRRSPALTYRRAFSAGACSLAYGAVSVLAHAVAVPVAGHVVPPRVTLPIWVLVIAACELAAVACVAAAILIAIKGSASATRVLPLALNRTFAVHELIGLALGTAATLAAAASPLLTIAVIPAVIVALRKMIPAQPGLAPAS